MLIPRTPPYVAGTSHGGDVDVARIVIVGVLASVVVTLAAAQPAGTRRLVVVGIALAVGLGVVVLGRAGARPLWRSWGGVVAAGLLAVLFAVTGGIETIYQDAVMAVMVVSALTLPPRLVVVNSSAALAAAASPWLYDPGVDWVLLADLLADAGVWSAITLGVALQARTLESQARRLVESDQLRVAFLRATSHELRTPLTAVSGFATTLQEHGDRLDRDQQREYVERIAVNAERLTDLIGDLLDVDRLASGVATAQCTSTDLAALVQRVVASVDPGDTDVVTDLAPASVPLDVAKFERVVLNLVVNAVRHSPPGGTVEVRVGESRDQVVLEVRDHGGGVPAGWHERIFEPFVQGPERRDAARPGTGLGLTLARQLVELHSGTLVAHDADGGGALFRVCLPAEQGADARERAVAQA